MKYVHEYQSGLEGVHRGLSECLDLVYSDAYTCVCLSVHPLSVARRSARAPPSSRLFLIASATRLP